ncbi:TonB-dependent receptor, partial [bacterium]|nr:TonB-dependent receptor [bacterium]
MLNIIICKQVYGQEIYGGITGEVIDVVTKEPLPYVNVVVEGTQLGDATDEDGKFVILRIPVGLYSVKFSMMGYKPIIKPGINVRPNRKDFILAELQETTLELEGITITPSYFEKSSDAILSERSVEFEEIRQDPGSAEDIQRMMQALPSVVTGSDQMNDIIVRGGMPGENLFLLDNIEMPNPNHFGEQGTTGGPMNMINTYFVRQVDFYTGAFPARFGDKVSSVMNIKLREGNRERYEGNFNLGMAGAGVLFEGPVNKGRGSFILSARKSFLDLIISSTGLTAVPYYYSLQGKFVYDISDRTKMITNAIYGDDKINISEDDESGYSQGENVVIDSKSRQFAAGTVFRTVWSNRIYSDITFSAVGNKWDQLVEDEYGLDIHENNSNELITEVKGD